MSDREASYNIAIRLRDQSIIDGYIGSAEKSSFSNHAYEFYRNIPAVVNYSCTKYYHQSQDRFDPEIHGFRFNYYR